VAGADDASDDTADEAAGSESGPLMPSDFVKTTTLFPDYPDNSEPPNLQFLLPLMTQPVRSRVCATSSTPAWNSAGRGLLESRHEMRILNQEAGIAWSGYWPRTFGRGMGEEWARNGRGMGEKGSRIGMAEACQRWMIRVL
jgi:hypothetical protein